MSCAQVGCDTLGKAARNSDAPTSTGCAGTPQGAFWDCGRGRFLQGASDIATGMMPFDCDWRSDHDASILVDMARVAARQSESWQAFQGYIQASVGGFWDAVQSKAVADGLLDGRDRDSRQVYDGYQDHIADRMSVLGNKWCGSRKRNASFDFERFWRKAQSEA
jgi:hypothetical protein